MDEINIDRFFLTIDDFLIGLEKASLWNRDEDEIETHICRVQNVSEMLIGMQNEYGKRDPRFEEYGKRAGEERCRADRFAHRARNGDFPERYVVGK